MCVLQKTVFVLERGREVGTGPQTESVHQVQEVSLLGDHCTEAYEAEEALLEGNVEDTSPLEVEGPTLAWEAHQVLLEGNNLEVVVHRELCEERDHLLDPSQVLEEVHLPSSDLPQEESSCHREQAL